jgi:ribose transport system ATP-binding protein
MGDTAAPVLAVTGIVKEFPGVRALSGVDLALYPGEVHVVIGENGAGKSTLMKVLAGVHAPDEGAIALDGRQIEIRDPREALARGIATIHQELALVRALTVAENICLGREPRAAFFLAPVDRDAMRKTARDALARLSSSIDPDARIADLTVGEQQLVEIAKALVREARVLILDEPTASLSARESGALFTLIDDLKAKGVALAFISHRLDDIYRVGDRITVLRDGRTVHTGAVKGLAPDALIAAMVGRAVESAYPRHETDTAARAKADVVLRVDRVSRTGVFEDVSFSVRSGEIVGMAGLVGAGRTEVARALFGADPFDRGAVWLNGRPFAPRSPAEALAAGVTYLSEDRKGDGLLLVRSVTDNVTLSLVAAGDALAPLADDERDALAQRMVTQLSIKTPTVHTPVANLSGGNQQKVLLARCLTREPELVIVDEPTRGVDVGARQEIYERILELAKAGKGVLLISSDLPEVLALSDAVLVMCEGRLTARLARGEATSESVMHAALPRAHTQPEVRS